MAHPQGQFSQGKRSVVAGRGAESGSPTIPIAITISSAALIGRRSDLELAR
ncbi:hypothetical protein RRSWK_01957 [Rhodopirellula sp. SWK7]|nr:hypothetical protein RRSWK_01957 [Rhodopirellula sp. SWK7]